MTLFDFVIFFSLGVLFDFLIFFNLSEIFVIDLVNLDGFIVRVGNLKY